MMLTYVSERQRLVILPVFFFFFICALYTIFQKKKLFFSLGVVLILAYFSLAIKNDYMKEEDHLFALYNKSYKLWIQARNQRNQFQLSKARDSAAKAAALTPWLMEYRRPVCLSFSPEGFSHYALSVSPLSRTAGFSTRYNHAILLFEAGRLEDSEAILWSLIEEGRKFKRDFLHSSQPYYYLGRIAESRENWTQAAEYFKRALKNSPGSPFSLSHLFALSENPMYEHKLNRYFDKLDANLLIAEAFLQINKASHAIPYLKYIIGKIPRFRKAHIYLSLALSRTQQISGAAQAYLHAVQIKNEPIFYEKELLSVFAQLAEDNKNDPMARYYSGLILHHFGYYRQALEKLNSALELSPQNKAILKEIELAKKNLRHTK